LQSNQYDAIHFSIPLREVSVKDFDKDPNVCFTAENIVTG
jgi:hypothetical protein